MNSSEKIKKEMLNSCLFWPKYEEKPHSKTPDFAA